MRGRRPGSARSEEQEVVLVEAAGMLTEVCPAAVAAGRAAALGPVQGEQGGRSMAVGADALSCSETKRPISSSLAALLPFLSLAFSS